MSASCGSSISSGEKLKFCTGSYLVVALVPLLFFWFTAADF